MTRVGHVRWPDDETGRTAPGRDELRDVEINNCVIAGPEYPHPVGFGENAKTKRQIIFSHLGANRGTFWYKRPGFCGVEHTERAKTTLQAHTRTAKAKNL